MAEPTEASLAKAAMAVRLVELTRHRLGRAGPATVATMMTDPADCVIGLTILADIAQPKANKAAEVVSTRSRWV